MTLEALASSSLPAFVVYETISASSSQNFFNDNMLSMAFEGSNLVQDSLGNGGRGGGGVACTGQARRRKRRRQRNCKNKEEAENQRMTHIAVERNRRRLMNEHLAVLRSLMPESYIQRGDQASVVGGAIDFVKELEQHLQSLEVQKRAIHQQKKESSPGNLEFEPPPPPPFSQFFAYPQYTLCHAQPDGLSPAAAGDIEVTLIETHANLRILTHRRRPHQLLKMVAGLQALRLSILHLNVTTVEAMVLYSISVKVEEGCNLTTVDDIAAAVNHLLTLVEAEAAPSAIV